MLHSFPFSSEAERQKNSFLRLALNKSHLAVACFDFKKIGEALRWVFSFLISGVFLGHDDIQKRAWRE